MELNILFISREIEMYQKIICPFLDKPIKKMNKREAKKYLEWFIETKDEEVKYLEKYIQKENPKINLDRTVESLISVWEWFEPKIEKENRSLEDIEKETENIPQWMGEYIAKQDFTILTKKIAYDISIYFGEVLIYNNSKIYWGVETKPKNLVGVNWPRIIGFCRGTDSMWPYNLICVCMRKSLREKNSKRLYELYKIWAEDI